MSMALVISGWKSCSDTQLMKNKAFKGAECDPINRVLAIKLLKEGVNNIRVERKAGLSKQTICRIKSDIKKGLI